MIKKLAMLIAAAAAFGAWAETETIGGYTWTYQINGGTAEIYNDDYSAAISPSPTGAVAIPSTLGGKPVTSIGNWAFTGCSGLTSVTIGNGVTSIGDGAFYDCSGLTSVTIPDSVTSIWNYAFEGCSGLTSVTIGNGVTSIGNYAFEYCSGLTSVTIGNGVMGIGYGVFDYCSGLMSFTVGSGNANYKSVNGLLLSRDGTTLVAGVNGDVTIPDSVTSIGFLAFNGHGGLRSVTIPDSVTSIGANAFSGCSGLTSVTIPDSVTSIGDWAFDYCSGLMSFTVGSGNANYKSVNGLLLSRDGTTLVAGVNWRCDDTERSDEHRG